MTENNKGFLKGALTYTALAAIAAPLLGRLFGVELAEHELVTVFQAFAVVVAVYGRKRAT